MKPVRHRHNLGFGLIETILVLVVSGVLIAGVFGFFRSVSASSKAHTASQQAISLTDSIMRAYASAPSFVGISPGRVVAENLLPTGTEVHGPASEPVISTAFGGRLLIDAATIEGQAGRGAALTFTDVPKRMCGQFVANTGNYGFDSITINSQDVLDAHGKLQEYVVASACAAQTTSTVVFTVDRQTSGGGAPSSHCELPTPSTQTEIEGCPSGYVGSINRTRTAVCLSGTGTAVWGPWSVSNACAAACAPAPSSPETRTSTPCPAGQLGTITETRVSECLSGVGSPTWSDWTEVSNTCAPQCVAPADQLESIDCPAGQIGSITQRRSASCPAPTGPYEWGAWEETENTCVPACVAPAPENRSETRTQQCLPGRYTPPPTISSTFTQSRNITTTYTCPAEAGSPVAAETPSDWLPLESTACLPRCEAPSTQSEQRTQQCPSGQTGSITEQRSVSWACPSPVGDPEASYGPWRQIRNTCVAPCESYTFWSTAYGDTSRLVVETVAPCPPGQLGENIRSRWEQRDAEVRFTCPNNRTPTGNYTPWRPRSDNLGQWNYGNSCHAPRSCNVRAHTKFWGVGKCRASVPAQVIPHNGVLTLTSEINPNTGIHTPGQASYRCNDGDLMTSPLPGWTCG